MDAAVVFYRDVLGLPLIAQFGTLAFFDLGGVRLSISRPAGIASGNSVLYFSVDDLDGTRGVLQSRGVEFIDEPHLIFRDHDGAFGEPGHEEWMTFFRDPEGNVLALSARTPAG